MATWLRSSVVVSVLGGCSAPSSLDVGPPTPDDADAAGKADGASSGKAEVKVTIDAAHIRRARSRLALLNAESETRRIWFYDTPWLELYDAGVILREREIDGDDDDATVKLRPFELADLDARFRALDDMKCEIDQDLDSATSACSLKSDLLFSDEQADLVATYAPAIDWDFLVALGPIPARVWEIKSDELPEKVTVELWYMPDATQVLELSMKVKEADAADGLDTLVDLLADRDLDLASAQESKTLRALEALAGTLY